MECAFNLMLAAGISCSYVGLLYAFDFNGVDRNDPSSIKRRFFAAVVNNIIGILVTYILLHRHHAEPLQVMGIHTQGALPALVLPAILTSICYLGTWVMTYIDGHIGSLFGKRSFYTFLCYRMNLSDD
uniref:Aa_trans domain-containing protein n=1 Tax=Ascaris lumbricoides TaxID=6252 RepID=A0A0M3IPA5_ASCLU